jgi:hypothetical protein
MSRRAPAAGVTRLAYAVRSEFVGQPLVYAGDDRFLAEIDVQRALHAAG